MSRAGGHIYSATHEDEIREVYRAGGWTARTGSQRGCSTRSGQQLQEPQEAIEAGGFASSLPGVHPGQAQAAGVREAARVHAHNIQQ